MLLQQLKSGAVIAAFASFDVVAAVDAADLLKLRAFLTLLQKLLLHFCQKTKRGWQSDG